MRSLNIPNFRPDTRITMPDAAILYHFGGIGDCVQWTQAIIYNLKNYPYLRGEIFVKPFFYELAEYWLAPHLDGRFKITCVDSFKDIKSSNIICPTPVVMSTINTSIMEMGFMTYAQLNYIPKDYFHFPEIDCLKIDVNYELPEKYCVVTTMSTSGVRELKPNTINDISRYVLSKGFTPVFLGKENLDDSANYHAHSSNQINYSLGLDLRNKTSLLQAAAIMNKARFVVGLDNGLLHLACCTNTNVIFGFNTVQPMHRIIPRKTKTGKTSVVAINKNALSCAFCQTDTKFMFHHKYTECLYKDKKCLDLLDLNAFKNQMDIFL